MNPQDLTEDEYLELKKNLHHAHDKILRVTLQENEAMREFTEKILMPLLKGIKIDLSSLKLDNTSYTGPGLQAFYSDIVYLASLIDESTNEIQPVNVAFLIEHKSQMPSQLLLRLQIEAYINAIMQMNYDEKTDTTIPVLPIIFNQFQKGWEIKPFRRLFPNISDMITQFIPEFGVLLINLADLPDAIIESLDKYGILKAGLLAMKNVRNKQFLIDHFEDIFLFLQKHPDKTILRTQLITYLIGQSKFSYQDIQQLLNNIFSPVLKQDVMVIEEDFITVAYRTAKAEAMKELKIVAMKEAKLKTRLSVMRCWKRGLGLDDIVDITDLSTKEVKELITIFEKVKDYYLTTKDTDKSVLKKLSNLGEVELEALIKLLNQPHP